MALVFAPPHRVDRFNLDELDPAHRAQFKVALHAAVGKGSQEKQFERCDQQRHVASWRTVEGAPTATREAMTAKAPSPRQARWWLTLPSERLSASQRRFVEVLVRDNDRVRSAPRLAVTFGRVLRGHDAAALDEWLIEAEASEVVEFRTFVETLRHDVEAERAAITSPWSNGQTEGQVNKIKMLKRQMYGRASVDLLRQRLVAA